MTPENKKKVEKIVRALQVASGKKIRIKEMVVVDGIIVDKPSKIIELPITEVVTTKDKTE